jgi:glycosyltransferase involved in cell wall biosynthesis
MRIADTTAPAIQTIAFAPKSSTRIPASLPGGRPWPRIAVIVLARDAARLDATVASLRDQDYPVVEAVVFDAPPGQSAHDAVAEALGSLRADYALLLRAGDRLAPGALLASALATATEEADVVCGLRIVTDGDTPLWTDCTAAAPGPLDSAALAALFAGGELLRRSDALIATDVLHTLLRASPSRGAKLAVLGRPIAIVEAEDARQPAREHLKIAALTDTGLTGGAGIAHARLIEALRLAGHAVEVKHLAPDTPKWAAEWTSAFPAVEDEIVAEGFDLVLAGNIHGATRSAGVLARLHEIVPVAAVLHDLFLVTGRCAHPGGCTRILARCDAGCPSPDVFPELAPHRVRPAWLEKQRFLGAPRPPILLANSPWTASQARAFAPTDAAVEEIALPFPTEVFRPRDRRETRRALGLPEHDVLVMCAAQVVDAPHKGTGELAAALRRVARPGVGFVVVGRVDNPEAFGVPNAVFPGRIADEHQLAAYYAACDVFVTASRLETLGQTPIEAGLSGTPPVAYRATGLTAAVIDGVSGRLCAPDASSLSDAIQALVDDATERERLAFFGRLALESRYSPAAAYLSLHRALARHGILPAKEPSERITFRPELVGAFDAAPRSPLLVEAPVARRSSRSSSLVPRLRRAKQAIWGARTPLWIRRAAYALSLISRAVASRGSR